MYDFEVEDYATDSDNEADSDYAHDFNDDVLTNYLRAQNITNENKDKKLLTKSKVGYINRASNDYFCFKWTISNVSQYYESSEKVCILQSPEFKTGTNNGNIWILKLISRSDYNHSTKVQLHLISCKDPSNLDFRLSSLNKKNKTSHESKKSIDIAKCVAGTMVCEFENFIRESRYYDNSELPINKLILFFEIMNSSPKVMKITKHSKTDDLKLFLKNEKLSDVTISVGESKFHLHKAILASRSSVFLAMFEHDTKESRENLVEITDVDEKIMKKIILFIYTDEVEILEEDASDIYAVADKYDIEGLKSACTEVLSNSFTKDNVYQTLMWADTYNAKQLKMNALNYIASNLAELTDTSGYKMLRNSSPHLIEKILLAVAKKLKDL